MTAKESIEYMKSKEYYSHWILPKADFMNDINDNLKAYRSAPIGNSPKIMPLDYSLNFVFHSSVAKHVVLTKKLEKVEGEKFSTASPKEGLAA